MVPHYSGTTLDAQDRYAKGTRQIIENYLQNKPQEPANVIVGVGAYETKSCEYYTVCQATRTRRLTCWFRWSTLICDLVTCLNVQFLLSITLVVDYPLSSIT